MRELDLLQHIYGHNAGLPGHVLVPPGDDMAAIRIGDQSVLITVDQLADAVHIDAARTPLDLIARKAVTRNLSDVAAMAALPTAAVAAACLPRSFGHQRANRLFDAMRNVAQQYDCPLVGGDISTWDHPLMLTVTILAEPAGIAPITRGGAKPGDIICVTGRLGGAWKSHDAADTGGGSSGGDGGGGGEGGERLAASQRRALPTPHPSSPKPLLQPHLRFEPRIALARQIASIDGLRLRSMIDLTDGLASDLGHICERSNVAAEVDADTLPLRPEAHAAAQRDGRDAWRHALTDGEDYELCFTLDAADADTLLPGEIGGVPITRVGRILDREQGPPNAAIWLRHGERRDPITTPGWEHTG